MLCRIVEPTSRGVRLGVGISPACWEEIASETGRPKSAYAQNPRLKQIVQWRAMPNEGAIDKLSTRILLAATIPRGTYLLPYNVSFGSRS